jgi:hypothetical protein
MQLFVPIHIDAYGIYMSIPSVVTRYAKFCDYVMCTRKMFLAQAPGLGKDVEASELSLQFIPHKFGESTNREHWRGGTAYVADQVRHRIGNLDRDLFPLPNFVNLIEVDDAGMRNDHSSLNRKQLRARLRNRLAWQRLVRSLGSLPICTYDDSILAHQRDDRSGPAVSYTAQDGKPCYPIIRYSGPAQVSTWPTVTQPSEQ